MEEGGWRYIGPADGRRQHFGFRRERSEGRNAAADRPPVRCSATRPTPRADPSERTVGGCFKKKKICRGPLRHIGPPLGQSPPSNIRPRSARKRTRTSRQDFLRTKKANDASSVVTSVSPMPPRCCAAAKGTASIADQRSPFLGNSLGNSPPYCKGVNDRMIG